MLEQLWRGDFRVILSQGFEIGRCFWKLQTLGNPFSTYGFSFLGDWLINGCLITSEDSSVLQPRNSNLESDSKLQSQR